MTKGNILDIDPDFITVSLNLDMPSEGLPECLNELVAVCSQTGTSRVLGKVHGPLGSLTVADVFEMATFLSNKIPALQIALVVRDNDADELREFFQIAA